MRLIIGLLIACSVAFALAPPASAEEIPYAKIDTDTVRLFEIVEDAKLVCYQAMGSKDVAASIAKAVKDRDYNNREIVIMASMCAVYREGATDGYRVAQQLHTNRS